MKLIVFNVAFRVTSTLFCELVFGTKKLVVFLVFTLIFNNLNQKICKIEEN